MWSFIDRCILFNTDYRAISTVSEFIFGGYIIGLGIWSFLMYGFANGDEKKVFVAYWGQALGSLLLIRLVLGEAAMARYVSNIVNILQIIPLAAIAVISQRIFIDEMLDNHIGNIFFCIILSVVYTLYAGTPSWLDIVFGPVFVSATSYAVNQVDHNEAETFGFLIMTTLLLGAAFYYFLYVK